MSEEVLDALVARLVKRAEDGTDRTRFLVREPVPGPKEGNIAGAAQVTASSEYDYESADNFRAVGAIDGVVDGCPSDMTAEWASDHETVGAWLRLTWDTPQAIDRVLLFDRPHVEDKQGRPIDLSRVMPADTKTAFNTYIKNLQEGWYGITNTARQVGIGFK